MDMAPMDMASRVDDVRTARRATAVAFCAVGAVTATWAARIPAVQDRLDLSPGDLAVVALAIEAGAVCGLLLGAAVTGRLGSRRATAAAFVGYAPGVVWAAVAPGLTPLAVGLGLWAAANSVLDVALNAQGAELERRAERPLLSGLHAGQSAGLLVGAAVASGAAACGVPLGAHAAVVAVVTLVAGLVASRRLLPVSGRRRERAVRPAGRLLLLSAVAFGVFLADGTATTWLAVHVRGEPGSGPGAAAGAYLGFTAALLVGRLAGDRLTARLGRRRLVSAGCVVAALGLAGALAAPTLPFALAGWAVVGLALAPLAPAVLGAVASAAPVAVPGALATVTSIGYLGSFTGPPAVGALAETTGLAPALLVPVAVLLGTACLCRWGYGARNR
jgi:MFS family permease